MAASKKTKTTRRAARAARPATTASPMAADAISLLEADHREVDGYFDQFEDADGATAKKSLATQICLALKVHAQIEEELFYPAAREKTGDGDLIDEAIVEHAGAKILIAQIEAMQPGQDLYDAKVKVLGEQVRHHVREEEEELFPEVRESGVDLDALGARMAARKAELMALLSPAQS
jgi:hemerythrin superfamily protein